MTKQVNNEPWFRHFRKDQGFKKAVTVAGKWDQDILKISAAVCCKRDQFSKKEGRTIALMRLSRYPTQTFQYSDISGVSRGDFFQATAEALAKMVEAIPYLLPKVTHE